MASASSRNAASTPSPVHALVSRTRHSLESSEARCCSSSAARLRSDLFSSNVSSAPGVRSCVRDRISNAVSRGPRPRSIRDEEKAVRVVEIEVVGTREFVLTREIPDDQLPGVAIDFEALLLDLCPDRRFVVGLKDLLDEASHETRLANAEGPQHDDLLALRRCHQRGTSMERIKIRMPVAAPWPSSLPAPPGVLTLL